MRGKTKRKPGFRYNRGGIKVEDMPKDVMQQLSKFIIANSLVDAVIDAQAKGHFILLEVIPISRNPPENIAELVHEFVESKLEPNVSPL